MKYCEIELKYVHFYTSMIYYNSYVKKMKGYNTMSKSTDKVLEVLNPKKKTNKSEAIKKWLNREIWNGRPIKWLAIGLSYCAIAYATYSFSVYYINIPEFNGIAAFIATFIIGSRAFKNSK